MRLIIALVVLFSPLVVQAEVSKYLYINRCTGSCTIKGGGIDDARSMTSSLPCAGTVNCMNGSCTCNGTSGGTHVVEEYQNAQGQTGAAADAEWNAVMKCVREVYSPYDITIADVPPPDDRGYTMGILAGRPQNIGYTSSTLGLGAGGGGCAPADNTISFSFANAHGGTGMARVIGLCWTVAQETAHSFGLDHAFKFTDGRSACPDPMTYQVDCGSTQRFFRNDNVTCGENGARPCKCGGFQNAHKKLLSIFGAGTPITTPPVVKLDSPTNNATIQNGATVLATASAQRGIFRMELWLNNYKWASVGGAAFGSQGQPTTQYKLTLPQNVPDGVIDVVVKAYDDIDVLTETPKVTVTKGAPCATADTCANGQKCEQGRCFWDPPTGELGDACTYPQFCVTGNCLDTSEGQYCSQTCVVGVADSCPTGFECLGDQGQTGVCVTASAESGCCSVGDDGRSVALLSLLVIGIVLRRRPRR